MPRRPNARTSDSTLIAITRHLSTWQDDHKAALNASLVGEQDLGERLAACSEALSAASTAHDRERREDVEANEREQSLVEQVQQYVRVVRQGASVALSHRTDIEKALRDFGPSAIARRISTPKRALEAVEFTLDAVESRRELLSKKIAVDPLIEKGEALKRELNAVSDLRVAERGETNRARSKRDELLAEAHDLIALAVAGAELANLSDARPLRELDAILDEHLPADEPSSRDTDEPAPTEG